MGQIAFRNSPIHKDYEIIELSNIRAKVPVPYIDNYDNYKRIVMNCGHFYLISLNYNSTITFLNIINDNNLCVICKKHIYTCVIKNGD